MVSIFGNDATLSKILHSPRHDIPIPVIFLTTNHTGILKYSVKVIKTFLSNSN